MKQSQKYIHANEQRLAREAKFEAKLQLRKTKDKDEDKENEAVVPDSETAQKTYPNSYFDI